MITIGCDPEFFLKDIKSGKLISGIPFISGTKEEPKLLPKGGNIQRDNVAVEIATDPAISGEDFVEKVRDTLSEMVKVVPTWTKVIAIPSANFDPDQLDHPEAQAFGCSPDFDAWEVRKNDPPYADDSTFRSCGAHIHVGTDGKDDNKFLLEFEGKLLTVRVMDCLHGIISTVLDSSPESIARRALYGNPGAHRPKDYGVEYRVLSNYWLKSPVTVMLMYHLTQDALKVIREGKAEALIAAMGENQIKNTIKNGDVESALRMLNDHVLPLLCEDSLYYYNEALAKIQKNDMNFHTEWELYKEEAA